MRDRIVTILLLVSIVFLGEGIACVLMAAPVFFLVAALVGLSTLKLR